MSVAPSFQKLELAGKPFAEGDKEYVYVRYPDGHTRKVRWYEEEPKRIRSVKDVLGFEKGYITIFRGDCTPLQEWFEQSCARYHVLWGWYIISTDEVPPLPAGISAVELPWSAVSLADGTLKPATAITREVEARIYEPSKSEYLGEIGNRLDFEATITKVVPIQDYFGTKNFYVMETPEGNVATWTTAAKVLLLGNTYNFRGTIKDLTIYKGEKQTILTRCSIL